MEMFLLGIFLVACLILKPVPRAIIALFTEEDADEEPQAVTIVTTFNVLQHAQKLLGTSTPKPALMREAKSLLEWGVAECDGAHFGTVIVQLQDDELQLCTDTPLYEGGIRQFLRLSHL